MERPADASCLIYLAKAGAYDALVPKFGLLLASASVWFEAVDEGERIGAPEVDIIRVAHGQGMVRRVELSASEVQRAKRLRSRGFGRGESDVLALGARTGSVVIDEGKGSRIARERGLEAISVLRIPVIHFERGRMDEREAIHWTRRLAEVMNVTADVLAAIERRLMR